MKALALVESPDHVCARYRLRAYEPHLRDAGWSLTFQPLEPGLFARRRQLRSAARYDVTVLQRKLLSGWMLRELRRQSRRLVFDFDDAVLYRDSYDPRGPHCARRLRRFARTVRAADVVVAGNAFLARCAAEASARDVRIIPTCVEPDRLPVRPAVAGEPGRLELVWIGSSSTLRGLEQAKDLWTRVARELPGVRLKIVADKGADLGPIGVETVRWSRQVEGPALAAADAGISLVPDDLWSRGKCGLKILQYQAAGLATVANRVGVHGELVEEGRTGYLADTPEEWLAALRSLHSSPLCRIKMGLEARKHVEERYSVNQWAPALLAALVGAAPAGSRVAMDRDDRRPALLEGLQVG
jgi:glycosyltransferase involved in cell wall biosynthesis